MPDDDATADTPRYVVVGGGEPSAEQLAALTVALTPVVVVGESTPEPSGWVRAGLLEAVGGRPFASPAELDLHGP